MITILMRDGIYESNCGKQTSAHDWSSPLATYILLYDGLRMDGLGNGSIGIAPWLQPDCDLGIIKV